MRTSEKTSELFAAMSKAQAAFAPVKKDAANPFFKSAYATLLAIVEALRKPLADNGLAFAQGSETVEGKWMLATTIMHASGEWLTVHTELATAAKPQDMGSALTYARRYGIQAAFGVVLVDDGDDDDANRAQGLAKPGGKTQSAQRQTDAANDEEIDF